MKRTLLYICLPLFISLFPRELILAEEFKVGVLLCLTGECAEWGANSIKGIELAVKELNDSGGVLGQKIKLVVQDTAEASGGAVTVTAFKNISLDRNIRYFIGPTWTPGGLALAPIVSKKTDIIITSPSLGVAEFNESGDNVFNVWPHDEISSKSLARFAIEKGWKRAAIFSSQQPWENAQGRAFESEFRKNGGEIASIVEPLPTGEVKAEALKIKSSDPDVVFFSNTNQMGVAAKELQKLKYSKEKLAILMDDTRLKVAEGALEGAIFARYPDPAGEFVRKYNSTYGIKPGIASDTAYDVMKLYAKAIQDAGTFEVSKVKSVLASIEYNGASGKIKFDPQGGVIKEPVLYVVRGDRTEPMA